MSASIGASAEAAGVPGEAGPAAVGAVAIHGAAPAHEHSWALMRFELVDDRPMVRQQCEACGFVRGYRAWERYWTPGEGEVRR